VNTRQLVKQCASVSSFMAVHENRKQDDKSYHRYSARVLKVVSAAKASVAMMCQLSSLDDECITTNKIPNIMNTFIHRRQNIEKKYN
jgi:hypothetical protein